MRIPTHVCHHCGHRWKEATLRDAKQVITAAKTNKRGPWCALCYHLKTAQILAGHRASPAVYGIEKALEIIHAP